MYTFIGDFRQARKWSHQGVNLHPACPEGGSIGADLLKAKPLSHLDLEGRVKKRWVFFSNGIFQWDFPMDKTWGGSVTEHPLMDCMGYDFLGWFLCTSMMSRSHPECGPIPRNGLEFSLEFLDWRGCLPRNCGPSGLVGENLPSLGMVRVRFFIEMDITRPSCLELHPTSPVTKKPRSQDVFLSPFPMVQKQHLWWSLPMFHGKRW